MGKSLWWLDSSRRTPACPAWGRDCDSERSVSLISSFDLSARTALVAIETESDRVEWAAAGSNLTLYLTAIDPIHLDVGRVLCSPSSPVELASAFTARIIVFDIQVPILAGTSVSDRINPPHLANHVSRILFRSSSFIILAMSQRRYLN